MNRKRLVLHYGFRCDSKTQQMLVELGNELELNKSEVIRECIRNYYDSFCNSGVKKWDKGLEYNE